MNTQPKASQHLGDTGGVIPDTADVIGRWHTATEVTNTDPTKAYRNPTCLLAIGIHEIGRTTGTLRFAWALGNDELAGRIQREQEGWSHLYEFTCQRICPALRVEAIAPEAASVFADAALAAMPATVPGEILAYLRRRLTSCAAYPTADDCPFLNPLDDDDDDDDDGAG